MPSLVLTPAQGMATVAEETVVPTESGAFVAMADAGAEGPGLAETEASQAHIYFKDLKLLAHAQGDESEEEESEDDAQLSPYMLAEGEGSGHDGLGSPEGRGDTVSFPFPPSPPRQDRSLPGPRCLCPGHWRNPKAGAVGSSPLNRTKCRPAAQPLSRPASRRRAKRVDRQKLVIILVGLPARGKTFLCNKIMCYFNWLGHPTRHFNVGNYRRLQARAGEVQDASFFDPGNPNGMEARQRALVSALEDMEGWLDSDGAQVRGAGIRSCGLFFCVYDSVPCLRGLPRRRLACAKSAAQRKGSSAGA